MTTKSGEAMRYHHIGIPTNHIRDDETYLPKYGLYVSGLADSPYGVEWMRFDEDSPLPEVVKTIPHVAFEVDDLEAALVGHQVIIGPNSPSEGVRVAFILHDGAPVEFLCFSSGKEADDRPQEELAVSGSGRAGVSAARRALSVFALLLLGAGGCAGPQAADDGWRYATPLEVGLHAGLLGDLEEAVTTGRFTNLHGVIVVKGGRLVLDAYAPGVDAGDLHYTASVTKTVGSLLLGIAMDRGLMPGLEYDVLDLGLADLFPEHREILRADPRKNDIRLRHVLSMTAGLEWDEDSHPYDDPRNDWVRVRAADDPASVVLQQAVAAPPGSEFVYSGGMSTLVGSLLDRVTGGAPRAFAERELFDPLGISEYRWSDLQGGLIDIPGGLYLRPRDMARIGQMSLQEGIWNGVQVVSREWMAESTREHVVNRNSPDYGLHWWVGDHYYQGRSAHLFMASGHGGQRIYVVPEFDLVVVVVQQVFGNPMADANNLSIMTQYILPAAGGVSMADSPADLDAAGLEPLVGAYGFGRGAFQVELREGELWALAENSPDIQLVPVGPSCFRGTVMGLIEVEIEFRMDEDGVAVGGRTSSGFTMNEFVRVAGPGG